MSCKRAFPCKADLAGDQFLQHFVVHRREEFPDVGLEDVAEPAGVMLAAVHGSMGALPLPAGVRVGEEAALEQRSQDVGQGVVDHPGPGTGPR